jgi:hypothetical protein
MARDGGDAFLFMTMSFAVAADPGSVRPMSSAANSKYFTTMLPKVFGALPLAISSSP